MEVEAGQGLVGQVRVMSGHLAAVGAGEDGLEGEAQVGVVAVPRHEDQAGDEALERIAAHEQGDPRPLLERQDAHGDPEQLVLGDLEQLVAGVGLQDVGQRLAVVAVGGEAGAIQRALHLLAQDRDGARTARVGRRGEQADEDALARDVALPIEALHGDGIHGHRPVDGREAVRLGDEQQRRLAQEMADVLGQGAQVAQALEDGEGLVAQDAQPSLGEHPRHG
jgi:hypothetical protein